MTTQKTTTLIDLFDKNEYRVTYLDMSKDTEEIINYINEIRNQK